MNYTHCRNCGVMVTEFIPIITNHFKGVISVSHGCPDIYLHKIYTWRDSTNQEAFRTLFEGE